MHDQQTNKQGGRRVQKSIYSLQLKSLFQSGFMPYLHENAACILYVFICIEGDVVQLSAVVPHITMREF